MKFENLKIRTYTHKEALQRFVFSAAAPFGVANVSEGPEPDRTSGTIEIIKLYSSRF